MATGPIRPLELDQLCQKLDAIRLPLHNGAELSLSADELTALSREIDLVADRLVSMAQAVQWNKQARRVFENKADCLSVKARLMAALAQQDQGGHQ